MQVNVYEEDTVTPHAIDVNLTEVTGDDYEEFYSAHEELKRSGRYWMGGGAAPLFYITPA